MQRMQRPLTLTINSSIQNLRNLHLSAGSRTPPSKSSGDIPRMSKFICFLFKSIITTGQIPQGPQDMNQIIPDSIIGIFEGILKLSKMQLPAIMLGLFYLQKLFSHCKEIDGMDSKRKIKLFVVCLMLSQKYSDDTPLTNMSWSHIIAVTAIDVNTEEMYVLDKLDYALYVPIRDYAVFCKSIQILAKVWNQLAGSPTLSPPPLSPLIGGTPPTPSTNAPLYLQNIERRINKRSLPMNDYSVLATPITTKFPGSFPSYPHSIFHTSIDTSASIDGQSKRVKNED